MKESFEKKNSGESAHDSPAESSAQKPLQILHLEDDVSDAAMIEALLEIEKIEFKITRVCGKHEFKAQLSRPNIDLILSDFSMPTFDGFSALAIARKERPEIPFIFVSGTIGEELAIQALKEGAVDYVLKDRMARLPEAIRRALNDTRILKERLQNERALRESQERLARAEKFSDIMITHIGLDGQWLKVPPSLCALLGYQEAELLASKIQDTFHPDDAANDWKQYQLLLESDAKSFSADKRYQQKNGKILWLSTSATLVSDKEGIPVHFLTYLRDITASVLAQESVRAQAELLNLTRDAILVCDLSGKILYWNKGAESLYGWAAGESIGQEAGVLLHPAQDGSMKNTFEQVIKNGSRSEEATRITKAQKKITVQSRCFLMHDNLYAAKSILVVDTDITEKKQLEAESLRHQRVQTVGALAGGIAHDLNNALTPVLIGISLLRNEPVSPDGLTMLDIMGKSARHGQAMVEQILSFSRGIGGQQIRIDLKQLITDTINMAKATFSGTIQVQTFIPFGLHSIKGNPTQLHQVILNLLINARDAMSQGGKLIIEAGNIALDANTLPADESLKPGDFVFIKVQDSGHGIAPELMDKIFESFFTTKQPGQGTGLGLSTALGIVKTHEGFLRVASEVGQGTTFTIYLPIAR